MFNSGRLCELNRSAPSTVKYYNPENLIFQHLPVNKKIIDPCKNNRLEEIYHSRNGIIFDTLNSADIVEMFKCGGVALELYEGFLCYIMQFSPFVDLVNDVVDKSDLIQKQGKHL